MLNPVGALHAAAHAGYGVRQAPSKPQQPAQQESSMPQDKVTIRSGDVDHDGDNR